MRAGSETPASATRCLAGEAVRCEVLDGLNSVGAERREPRAETNVAAG